MNKRRTTQYQPILLPKDQFQSEQEARTHLEKTGYNPNIKSTSNFYRVSPTIVGKDGAGTWKPEYQTDAYKQQNILGKDGAGTWKPEYQKNAQQPLGADPATWTPKYLQQGSKKKQTLTPAEMRMLDTQGNLRKYANIHDMRANRLEPYVPKGLDHYRRNVNMPFSMNKKKHEAMNSYANPNFYGFINTNVPGLSN